MRHFGIPLLALLPFMPPDLPPPAATQAVVLDVRVRIGWAPIEFHVSTGSTEAPATRAAWAFAWCAGGCDAIDVRLRVLVPDDRGPALPRHERNKAGRSP